MSDKNDLDEYDYFINDDDFPQLPLEGVSNLSVQHVSVDNISGGGGSNIVNVESCGGQQFCSAVISYKSNRCHGESSSQGGESSTSYDREESRMNVDTTTMSQDTHGNETSRESTSIPLGLKLTISPETLSCIESAIARMNKLKNTNQREKTKASNIPTLSLKIGNFEVKSMHEGHLVTKCYFAKRKLVWEILEGPLKSKIEMSWSDVAGIMADIASGILEVELNQPPSFAKEINPKPRKHTQWAETNDFTGGRASLFRRHRLEFSLGILDKLYGKLLQSDPRILRLSRCCFPTDPSPHFNTNVVHGSHLPIDFNALPSPSVPRLLHHQYDNTTSMFSAPTQTPASNVFNSVSSCSIPARLSANLDFARQEEGNLQGQNIAEVPAGGMLNRRLIVPEMENHLPDDFQGMPTLNPGWVDMKHNNTHEVSYSGTMQSDLQALNPGWVDKKHNNTHNFNEVSYSQYSTGTMQSDLHRICQGAMMNQNPGSKWESMLLGNNNWPDNPPNLPGPSNYTAAPNNPQFGMMPNVTAGSTNPGLMGGMQNEYPNDGQFTYANAQNLQQGQSSISHLPQENANIEQNLIQGESSTPPLPPVNSTDVQVQQQMMINGSIQQYHTSNAQPSNLAGQKTTWSQQNHGMQQPRNSRLGHPFGSL